MSEQDWICAYVIEFADDGEPEACLLHVGTHEDCERAADLTPAIAYTGDRPVSDSYLVVRPVREGET